MAEGNGDEITLRDWTKRVDAALVQAKQRAGPLAEAFQRFKTAEEELARLKQSPDEEDTRRNAALLLDSLNRVQAEAVPIWPAFPVAGAGLILVARVPYSGRISILLIGGTAIGFSLHQYLKPGPSISDGLKLIGDSDAARKKANEDMKRTLKEQDEQDTKQIEEDARKDQQRRSIERAKKQAQQPQPDKYTPGFFPVPGNATQRRFGYYKDGQFVTVPFDTATIFQGKSGVWKSDGRFYPTNPQQ